MTRVRRLTGFTMLEVLFALIIFAIGLITLAAMFPVALKQTQTSVDVSQGSAVGSSAVRLMSAVFSPMGASVPVSATNPGDPGIVYSLNDLRAPATLALWQSICGNAICLANPHYGWVGFYRRGLDSNGAPLPYMQTYAIAVAAGSEPVYVMQAGSASTTGSDITNGMLQPILCDVTIDETATPAEITFNSARDASGNALTLDPNNSPIAENAYVLISDDGQGASGISRWNGTFLLVGNKSPSGTANRWQLQAGYDLAGSLTGSGNSMKAFIVGRQRDPTSAAGNPVYIGPVQDLVTVTGTAPLSTVNPAGSGSGNGGGN